MPNKEEKLLDGTREEYTNPSHPVPAIVSNKEKSKKKR